MIVTLFAAGLLLIPSANAFWRLPCAKPVLNARVDPIVTPGGPSGHSHTIMGSNAIGFDTTFEDLRNSNCSTCMVKDDKSAYWIPELFYEHKNGSFEAVPHGGALIYYLQRNAPSETVEPFPDGLRMLAGNPYLRSDPHNQESKAISWLCINANVGPMPQTPNLGDTDCPNGLRAQVFFPACWDGVNIDSADHKSHMAYPDGIDNGLCPPTHPHHLISLFYEVWFSPSSINQAGGGRFVLSNGDPTGYGLHGDFFNGWDKSVLSRAVSTCTAMSGVIEDCPVFKNENRFYTGDQNNACSAMNPVPQENVDPGHLLPNLPGCVAVTDGPANATPADVVPGCVAGKANAAVPMNSTKPSPSAPSSAPSPPPSSTSKSATAPPNTMPGTPAPANQLAASVIPASTFTTDLAALANLLQGTPSPTSHSKIPTPSPPTTDGASAQNSNNSNHCGRDVVPDYQRREDTLSAHRRSRMQRRH